MEPPGPFALLVHSYTVKKAAGEDARKGEDGSELGGTKVVDGREVEDGRPLGGMQVKDGREVEDGREV